MQGETYISLDEHAWASLHLILHMAQQIFSKKLGGKQRAILSNKWFDSDCREAQRQDHMGLNSSHSIGSSRIAFIKHCMMKKRSHLERKQKDYIFC